MNGAQILVPITLFAGAFAMIFGVAYLRTRENLAMMEKGWNPKQYPGLPTPYRSLKWGLLLMGAGLGLFSAFLVDTGLPEEVNVAPVYFALIDVGGGIGLIISYFVEKREYLRQESLRKPGDRPDIGA